MNQPGRSCPLSYRYSPSVFRRAPELRSGAIYIVGGLYGNPFALERISDMAHAEQDRIELVFNGDFNWFNIDPGSFARINETVLNHTAIRGNVETELAHDEDADGCGCAYPEWVREDVVRWSNQIMQRLRVTAQEFPLIRDQLAALPMHLVAEVGGVRIAIVHGDAESLAGWSFAYEALSKEAHDAELKEAFHAANVSLFASTHTCLPAVKSLVLHDGASAIVNNGAAGMPNLKGTTFGLITRIATRPTPHPSALSLRLRDLHVDLLMVNYDQASWLELFQKNWPPGSSASLSYLDRVVAGPDLTGPISV
jgi:predicted phosphodiesterase